MKSFGVRLAAGAGTILVVAYAIALAQKDNQAASDTWNAKSAIDPNPAVPIGDGPSSTWLEQPDNELADQQHALAFNESSEPIETANPVAQVNYDQESVDVPAFALARQNEVPAVTVGDTGPTVIATPQVPLDTETSPTVPEAFPSESPDLASEPTASLALPESDSTGFANPTFATPSNPEQDLASSSPDLPSGFGASLPKSATTATTALTDSLGAAPSAATPTLDSFPEPNLSTFANEGSDEGLSADLSAVAATSASLALPTDTAPLAAAPEEASLNGDFTQQTTTGQPIENGNLVPTNTLRGTVPTQNQLRSSSTEEAFSASPSATPFASPNPLPADQPSAMPSLGQPVAATAFAGDAFAAGDTGSPNASVASIMAGAAVPAAAISAPATFRSDPAPMPATGYASDPVDMAPPNTAIALAPNATADSPGERRLEGAQTPSVIIQKRAPAEVKVGKPAAFVINVRNVGAVEALDVEVHDRIPAGMRLADASPAPQIQGNLLMWQIGSMPAGDERTITLQLIPEQEGELGSVARVSFEAAASVRTIATRPVLKIEQHAPKQVLIGQQVEIALKLSNTGSGQATNIEIWEDVPAGLSHPEGPQLKQNIGTLMPGEVRTDSLFLKAEKPGTIQNTIRLVGDDGLTAEETISLEVIAPQLQVSLQGPSRRFLERQAKYELNVANAGTAAATNVEISVQLSRGFTFVSTDFEGQYDPNRHAVFWSLAKLPAGASGVVPLTLLPVETGEQVIKINANADLSTLAQTERKMTVEGFADLGFSITNPKGPIEIGAETTYDIVVQNSGSKPDTNIKVQVLLPAGLELISVDGDAGTDGNGLVAFQPKAQLAPGQEFKYRVRARGTSAGTHIVKAVVVSDHSSVPVTKEDTTRVYADQ